MTPGLMRMTLAGMTDTIAVRHRAWLAAVVIAAQLLFVGGMLVLGAIEGHGYSAGRHDISDLGALTAQHATAERLIVGIAGAATIAFALLALRPSLGANERESVGPWLVALSLPGFDTMSDAFFRLDCRAADAGCTIAEATASWHGKAHIACFVIAALATVAAPFVLAHRMRRVDGWHDLAVPTRIFGIVTILALAVTAASSGTAVQGWTQRGSIVLVALGILALGCRVVKLQSVQPGQTYWSPVARESY
jgi:hypothetical membrane protein